MAKKKTSRSTKKTPVDPSLQRINKVLAAAGHGSRRDVEELVVQGRVQVDNEIITDLAFRCDPRKSKIKVDGVALKRYRPVYFALNKPPGILSTNRDPSGRMRVIDLVPNSERVFSVGRLDKSSEGLILLTNDGELAQKLAHPKYKIQKTYFVVVAGLMENEELAKLRKGVHLSEGFARIDGATIRKHRKGCTELEIVLSEGKNREIRRILARAGHKVVVLRRIAIGTLRLGQMPVGASRELTHAEVKALYAISQPSSSKSTKTAGKPKPGQKVGKKPKGTAASSRLLADDDLVTDNGEGFEIADFESGNFEDFDLNLSESDEAFSDASFGDDDFLGDDDFVGGFDTSSKPGSVIGSDEELADAARSRAKKGRGKAASSSRTAGSGSTRKTASGRGASASRTKTTGRGASKKSATRSGPKSASGSTSSGRATRGAATSKRAPAKKKASGGAGASRTPARGSRTGGKRKSAGSSAPRGKARRR